MICPACGSKKEMLYSALAHAFICEEEDCGLEIEMDEEDAQVLVDPKEDSFVA